MESNYSEQLAAFRFRIESEIKKRIDSGLVWDKTDILENQSENSDEFYDLPEAEYQEDGLVDYYKIVQNDLYSFKGVRTDEWTEDYWFSLDEIPIESLCQILDMWYEKNN